VGKKSKQWEKVSNGKNLVITFFSLPSLTSFGASGKCWCWYCGMLLESGTGVHHCSAFSLCHWL